MEAIKKIISVRNHQINIELPKDFIAEQVEVIILPFKENVEIKKQKNSERFSGAISKQTATKLHKHLNDIREEWQNDIS